MQAKNHQRKKKQIVKPQYKNLTAFKAEQKHYKLYQGQQTDFSKLFVPTQQNFVEVDGYQVCELPFPQGAYYVKNFTPFEKVIQIGYYGLNFYCKRPYRTNLDSRNQLYEQKQQRTGQQPNGEIQQKQMKEEQTVNQKAQNHKQNQNENKQQNHQIVFDKNAPYFFNQKIRWANVGYQYDWTLRKYPQMKTPVHQSIQQLSDRANKLFNSIQHIKKQYRPQSAIINYYGVKDYMTGHLDDAEIDQQSPIYSFSFGLSCIFLMGGRTKEQKPTAVRLNSGDLLIMAGQSRKCYHGVPRVLQSTFNVPEQQQQQIAKDRINTLQHKQQGVKDKQYHNSYVNVKQYLTTHRININIRQVYPQGH